MKRPWVQSLPIVPDEQGVAGSVQREDRPCPWQGAGAEGQLTCSALGRPPLHPDLGHSSDQRVVPIALTDEVDDLICDVFDGVFILPNVLCRLQEEAHS